MALVDVATDREVWMLYSSFRRALGPGLIWAYGLGALKAEHRITGAFRTGAGLGWHEHDEDVFAGCELFFRPGYAANLVPSWIRAVRGCAYSGLGL